MNSRSEIFCRSFCSSEHSSAVAECSGDEGESSQNDAALWVGGDSASHFTDSPSESHRCFYF